MSTAVVAGSAVSDQEAVAELRAAWAEVSRAYARCWAAMAEVASRTTIDWETAEIAAALTFTTRRADYELCCAQTLLERLPRVYAALAAGELDHHKARVFTDYLENLTPAQAERISARLVPRAPGWTTGQLAARLLREVQAIDPDYTRRNYEQAIRERGVHGYLDHTGTAVLSGTGLPAEEAAAAAARLEALADALRAAGYPATLNQTRADLFLRLLDGSLDGLSRDQILTTMLTLGPLTPADTDPHSDPHPHPAHHQHPQPEAPDQPEPAQQSAQAEQPEPAAPHQPAARTNQPHRRSSPARPGSVSPPPNPRRTLRLRAGRVARCGVASRCECGCPPCSDSMSTPRNSPAGAQSPPPAPGTSSPPNTTPNGASPSSTPRAICSMVRSSVFRTSLCELR